MIACVGEFILSVRFLSIWIVLLLFLVVPNINWCTISSLCFDVGILRRWRYDIFHGTIFLLLRVIVNPGCCNMHSGRRWRVLIGVMMGFALWVYCLFLSQKINLALLIRKDNTSATSKLYRDLLSKSRNVRDIFQRLPNFSQFQKKNIKVFLGLTYNIYILAKATKDSIIALKIDKIIW